MISLLPSYRITSKVAEPTLLKCGRSYHSTINVRFGAVPCTSQYTLPVSASMSSQKGRIDRAGVATGSAALVMPTSPVVALKRMPPLLPTRRLLDVTP